MKSHELTVHYWRVVFVIWLVVLTIATHLPHDVISKDSTLDSPDKLLHFLCFGMLAFMCMCSELFRSKWLMWLALGLWVVVDEITQEILPLNRPFSYEDIVAGEFGICAAMIWTGSLSGTSTQAIREATDRVFSQRSSWLLLIAVAIISSSIAAALLWLILRSMTGNQYSDLSMFVGIVVGAVSVLFCFERIGNIRTETKLLKKNMVIPLTGTITLAAMVGFTISHTMLNPWISTLIVLVAGSRLSWNRVT